MVSAIRQARRERQAAHIPHPNQIMEEEKKNEEIQEGS